MDQYVLVLNCGSSSIKFAIIEAKTGTAPLHGLAENLCTASSRLVFSYQHKEHDVKLPVNTDHQQALVVIAKKLKQFKHLSQKIVAVGHRVVHGGETFTHSSLINDQVKQAIQQTSLMAPLHNPANLAGINSAQTSYPHLPHVAVFDTAFFQTMPKHAYLYALPYELYQQHNIRRYGFHGTSHYFVAHEAANALKKELSACNLITAHLGNGCSIAAVRKGKAIDTSLGFTPLEGLVMGTRCGDIDPSLPTYLIEQLGYSVSEVSELLNKKSGLLGISELSNDCRIIEQQANDGNQQAQLALDMFIYRLVKYIGAYIAVVGPLDALVFTGGIGENSAYVRENTINQLTHLGLQLDPDKNLQMRFGQSGLISHTHSKPIFAIATNEEWVIAKDTIKYAQ
ncbi:acetate kinase [uncultured Paraglaciecola sp.]|jgi:acetate kinase|uniref:acetate kinase n=1 Tax=uncultured Paraglaciecola sp. TaxID=1765024 RepID=UPI00263448B8|nr:acetate kinase [uncultured Paraglaciecola sp.]